MARHSFYVVAYNNNAPECQALLGVFCSIASARKRLNTIIKPDVWVRPDDPLGDHLSGYYDEYELRCARDVRMAIMTEENIR